LNMLEIEQSHLDIRKMNVQTCGISQQLWVQCDRKEDVDPIRTRRDPIHRRKLVLKRIGDSISQETIISNIERPEDADLTDPRDPSVFSLKYLGFFCKCQSFSENMELYMKSDYPLIIRFHNVTLGELKLCLSPFLTNVELFCVTSVRTHWWRISIICRRRSDPFWSNRQCW
jgi:hypothetical protein